MERLSGVVSLYDLLQFHSELFTKLFSFLNRMESIALDNEDDKVVLSEKGALAIYTRIGIFLAASKDYGFASIEAQCVRIRTTIERKKMVLLPGEMAAMLGQLRERCEDELGSRFFLCLEPKQGHRFENPTEGWDEVVSRFPKMKYNIDESAKCFALERYGAAVFHVLQVAEYGVIQVADLLGVSGDKPGWGSLKRLATLIKEPFEKRAPDAQQYSKLLENVVPLGVIIKDSWRHKLDHVDNQIVWVDTDFSPMVAEEIVSATRAFMRKLAAELPQ